MLFINFVTVERNLLLLLDTLVTRFTFEFSTHARVCDQYKLKTETERIFFFLLQTPPRHNLCTYKRPCHPTIFFTFSLSLSLSLTSHLSSLHLPLSLPLTSSSPTLSPPRLFISPIDLFISHEFFSPYLFISLTSSSPMDLSLTSSSPQLIASSISYLNSPLLTALTIGDAVLKFFFCPCDSMVVCV
jgi:hypothetical protein